MTVSWAGIVLVVGVGAVVAAIAAAVLVRVRARRLLVRNHRGADVPAVLGPAAAAGIAAALVPAGSVFELGVFDLPGIDLDGDLRWLLAGAGVVFLAGLVDDLSAPGPRGLRGHLRSLARGRPTTGLLKVAAAVAAGVACIGQLPPLPADGVGFLVARERTVLGAGAVVVVVAGSANLWNGLDVAPGRAGKWFAAAAVALLVTGAEATAADALLAAGLGAALGTLPFDLRERGMLGDAGANLLGVLVGFSLATSLSEPWLMAAAVIVVALNLVAETVTLSRVIAAVPPLRWLDRLGRRP